jgi:hypothetical protein
MSSLSGGMVVSVALVLAAVASDVWVLGDARDRQRRGSPASVSIGSLRIETPEAWFLGCVVLWVIFMPLYLTATGRNPFVREG